MRDEKRSGGENTKPPELISFRGFVVFVENRGVEPLTFRLPV
jgi:hypothetical protein